MNLLDVNFESQKAIALRLDASPYTSQAMRSSRQSHVSERNWPQNGNNYLKEILFYISLLHVVLPPLFAFLSYCCMSKTASEQIINSNTHAMDHPSITVTFRNVNL